MDGEGKHGGILDRLIGRGVRRDQKRFRRLGVSQGKMFLKGGSNGETRSPVEKRSRLGRAMRGDSTGKNVEGEDLTTTTGIEKSYLGEKGGYS